MSEEEKEAVISGSDLLDDEKDRMRKARDPNREFVAIRNWQQIARARDEKKGAPIKKFEAVKNG